MLLKSYIKVPSVLKTFPDVYQTHIAPIPNTPPIGNSYFQVYLEYGKINLPSCYDRINNKPQRRRDLTLLFY